MVVFFGFTTPFACTPFEVCHRVLDVALVAVVRITHNGGRHLVRERQRSCSLRRSLSSNYT